MSRPAFSEALVQTMYAAYVNGASLPAVAKQFGRAHSTVHKLFKNRGMKLRPAPLTDATTVTAMFEDYQSGLSLQGVGEKWQRDRCTIRAIFKNHTLPRRSQKSSTGVNHATKSAKARLGLLMKSFGGEKSMAIQLRRAA